MIMRSVAMQTQGRKIGNRIFLHRNYVRVDGVDILRNVKRCYRVEYTYV